MKTHAPWLPVQRWKNRQEQPDNAALNVGLISGRYPPEYLAGYFSFFVMM
ncbi:hypothetical protein [Photorhabdus temperata]|nr:hypothetical protein [Photorhabdus temperata]